MTMIGAAVTEPLPGPELSFKVGEEVMALAAGSTQWCKGRILNNVGTYEVEFDDKSKHNLDTFSVTAARTPAAKNKRSTRPASPSRKARNPGSPSRSRVRKSPSRAPTASKSPTRKTKTPGTPSGKRTTSVSKITSTDGNMESNVGGSTRRSMRQSIAVLPLSLSEDEFALYPSSVGNNGDGGIRRRDFGKNRLSANVVALQTARVAGIVTPGLIAEVGIANKSTSNRIFANSAGLHQYHHFCGPFGAFVLSFILPLVILATYGICYKCASIYRAWHEFQKKKFLPPNTPSIYGFSLVFDFSQEQCSTLKFVLPHQVGDYLDLKAVAVFFGWLLFQAFLFVLPVGRHVSGQPLRDGTRLKYRMNGPLAFFLSLGLLCSALYNDDSIADLLLDKLLPIGVTALAFTYVLALFLYVRARYVPTYDLNPQVARNAPNFFYDFFMGRELNPRPLGFELKMFLELRPGLIGWAAINVAILWKDWARHDGQISPALLVSAVVQIVYVLDALWFEEATLSTFDVTTEGLGFMLIFGDLVFVPTVFSLTSRFLLLERRVITALPVVGITALGVLGYVIFRASNMQKDEFRCNQFDPSVSHLRTINTNYVKKILAGGWWGWVRHPNYFGDFLIALSICLPSGFVSVIPYAYCAYLFPLLVHRACRDEDLCCQKYGAAWDEYKTGVRYRIVKYVY